jgi:peptidoglycan/LPS O-acetylase OafA/YrhL
MSFQEKSIRTVNYRPDIDGLRAFAILAVVLYYAFPKKFEYGFLGVDIFFVISGYVITRILIEDLQRGEFNFFTFWGRRVKRLLPALLTILIFSLSLGYFMLWPTEYESLSQQTISGLGFFSNIFFEQTLNYFEGSNISFPLLHLWSLAVEAQFYLFIPLLFFIFYRLRISLLHIIMLLIVISLCYSYYLGTKDTAAAFYQTPSRIWQLCFGSLIAYASSSATILSLLEKQSLNRIEAIRYFSLVLILLGFISTNSVQFVPVPFAILPVVGIGLLILMGTVQPNQSLIVKILSHKKLVFIGLISYPLYLWHWPFFSFAYMYLNDFPSYSLRILLIILSFLFAYATYRFIETPIRKGHMSNLYRYGLLAICSILVMAFSFAIFKTHGLKDRFLTGAIDFSKAKASSNMTVHMNEKNYFQDVLGSHFWSETRPNPKRDFFLQQIKAENDFTIAVIGDSHANRLFVGLKQIFPHINLLNYGRGTCPPYLNVNVLKETHETYECQPLMDSILEYVISEPKIDLVILHGYDLHYNKNQNLIEDKGQAISQRLALQRTIDKLQQANKNFLWVLGLPEVPLACYLENTSRQFPIWQTSFEPICFSNRDEYKKMISDLKLGEHSSNIYMYSPENLFCYQNQCGEIHPQYLLFSRDGNHLNDFGSFFLAKDLASFLHKNHLLKAD